MSASAASKPSNRLAASRRSWRLPMTRPQALCTIMKEPSPMRITSPAMAMMEAADVPLHGDQEGRFFHGYYDCHCYLPLYVYCGRHLLAALLRRSNQDAAAGAVEEVARIVGQIRGRWPRTRILLRGDSGFAREGLMAWCETNRV